MPDTTIGQIIWGGFLLILAILPLTLISVYLSLSSKCSSANSDSLPQQPTKKGKSKHIIITFIVIIVLSGLTAQAINHSYHRQLFTA